MRREEKIDNQNSLEYTHTETYVDTCWYENKIPTDKSGRDKTRTGKIQTDEYLTLSNHRTNSRRKKA